MNDIDFQLAFFANPLGVAPTQETRQPTGPPPASGMVIKPALRGNCTIKVSLTGVNFGWLSQLPGFKKWEGRLLNFRPTGANIAYIHNHWPDAQWLDGAQKHLDKFIADAQEAAETRSIKLGAGATNTDFQFKTIPRAHQLKAFLLNRDKTNFALLMEQGTGKTKVILDTAAYLYAQGRIDSLVVIAPKGADLNWIVNEIPAHLPDWCQHESVCLRIGSYSETKKGKPTNHKLKVDKVLNCRDRLRIITTNVECFVSDKAKKLLDNILCAQRVMLVIDESTIIKNSSAKRTKFLTKISQLAIYRRIMTGTPVTNSPEDTFAQFRFLDPMILGHDTLTTFRRAFCESIACETGSGHEFRKTIGYKNLDELAEMIDGHSFRVLKADCLDLPKKIYKRYVIELTPKQKALYKQLKNEYIAELEAGHFIEVPLALTRLMRLNQITCNWWPGDEEDKTVRPIDAANPRLEALDNILANTDGKAIIWAHFKPDLLMLTKHLGNEAVSYYGGISDKLRAAAIERFQNDPSIRWFIGNAQSAGRSHTLTAADTVVYYSLDYSLEKRLQSEDRAHRIGQTKHVVYYDIEARATVNGKIIGALKEKKNIADLITKDPKSVFMEEDDETDC